MTNFEIFKHNNCEFKIVEKSQSNEYCIVVKNDTNEYDWMDKLNKHLIISNECDKSTIKKKIIKYLEKFGCKINYENYKLQLQQFVETSFSPMSNKNNKKQLFDKNMICNILINEFIECHKKMSNKCKLSFEKNNIFVWSIEVPNVSEKIKNAKLELCFHGDLYPNFPPTLKIIEPHLKNTLGCRISNSKMVQLDYWTPTRNPTFIIQRTLNIMAKYGEIDNENKKIISENIINLELLLQKLSSFSNSIVKNDVIDDDYTFIKFGSDVENTTQTKLRKEHWKGGTGFGHYGASEWNISEYIKSQEEKNVKLKDTIIEIINTINSIVEENNFSDAITVINNSLLIAYLNNEFYSSNMLEILKREELYEKYLYLLELIVVNESSVLLNDTVFETLKLKYEEFNGTLKFDNENKFAKMFVNFYNNKISKKQITPSTQKNDKSIMNERELYKSTLTEFRFDTCEILNTNYKKEYKDKFAHEKSNNWKNCQKRLSNELSSLMPINQLPIEYDSSIFVRVDENNSMIIRALITGPVDTPYDSGCFVFDIYTPSNYPISSPDVWFMNHGGERFNPNLYESGKVCLSILGTYIGPKPHESEKWNPSTSSLLQVLVSIQAQILIEKPYFNEPSYETKIGSTDGENNSKIYNDNIKLRTMKSTVLNLLQNAKLYPQFEEVIKNHFKIKKNYILSKYKQWCDEAPTKLKSDYNETYNKINELLNLL